MTAKRTAVYLPEYNGIKRKHHEQQQVRDLCNLLSVLLACPLHLSGSIFLRRYVDLKSSANIEAII